MQLTKLSDITKVFDHRDTEINKFIEEYDLKKYIKKEIIEGEDNDTIRKTFDREWCRIAWEASEGTELTRAEVLYFNKRVRQLNIFRFALEVCNRMVKPL